jgi:hypothetical protein
MSVKVFVSDRYARPISNASIMVLWKPSGTSSGRTGSNGVLDLGCSGGVIAEVSVNGRKVVSYDVRVGDNDTFPVTYE